MIIILDRSEGPDCAMTFGDALWLRENLRQAGIPCRLMQAMVPHLFHVRAYDDLPRPSREKFYDGDEV